MDGIRDQCIRLNATMILLHVKLAMPHELEIINVGEYPCDAKGDTLNLAFEKVNTNLTNVLATIVRKT